MAGSVSTVVLPLLSYQLLLSRSSTSNKPELLKSPMPAACSAVEADRGRLIGLFLGRLLQNRPLQIPGLVQNLLLQMPHRLLAGLDTPAQAGL